MRRMQQRIGRHESQEGFTLIELLVVIIILGILAAVVVFAVSGVGDKGKSSAVKIDERTVRTAEEAYCAKNGRYGSGSELVSGGFLSDYPEYSAVTAQQGGGSCNGWSYTIAATVAAGGTATPEAPGQWTAMTAPHAVNEMVRLSDGRVLAIGADGWGGGPNSIWDPATNGWTPVDGNFDFMFSQAAELIYDDPSTPASECAGIVDNCGKVLMKDFSSWFLFDPDAPLGSQKQAVPPPAASDSFTYGTWDAHPPVRFNVNCGTNCGKFLLSSIDGPGPYHADLYDPKDNSFTPIAYPEPCCGTVYAAHAGGKALLPDGRVLFTWLNTNEPAPYPMVSQLFDPATLTWSEATKPGFGVRGDAWSEPYWSVLPNGEVLFPMTTAGPPSWDPGPAQIYTPAIGGPGSWRTAPACPAGFCLRVGTLPDGRVVHLANQETYIFDPASDTWSRSGDTNTNVVKSRTTLDSTLGPCVPYCGKLLAGGASGGLEMYTP